MPGPQIESLLWLLDFAFDGDNEHSLIANLRNVDDATWTALPKGASGSSCADSPRCPCATTATTPAKSTTPAR